MYPKETKKINDLSGPPPKEYRKKVLKTYYDLAQDITLNDVSRI